MTRPQTELDLAGAKYRAAFSYEEPEGLEPGGWLSEQRSRGERSQRSADKDGELCRFLTTPRIEQRGVQQRALPDRLSSDITVEDALLHFGQSRPGRRDNAGFGRPPAKA